MPFADYSDFDDCTSKNKDKGNPDAYCGSIKHKVEDSKSEGKLELKDPRGDGAVLDDRGQPNIIDYSNQEPMLYQIGENSSHEYPGKIVINNESRYVDREVKKATIPGPAETGRDSTGADRTQPTLPTGAPYELQKPSHNMHGMNFNTPIDWSKQEVVSIGSGLVARQIGTEKKKEGGPGSGRLASLAGKISAHAPLVTSQLVTLASQIPLEGVDEEDRKEMIEAIMKNEVQQLLREAQFLEEQHPRVPAGSPQGGEFLSGGGTSVSSKSDVVSKLKLNTDRIDTITQNHLESKATYPMNDAGAYFEGNLPAINSFQQFQTEEELFDMKEAIENGEYEKSDALFLDALKRQPKALGNFREISEDLAGFNGAMEEKTKNAKEIFRFTDTGELESYLEKDAKFTPSHYAVGKDADYKCFTLEPFNKFFRDGAEVIITYPTDTMKENMSAAEYSSFPRSEAYGNKKAIDNEKSGKYALETEVRVKADTKVPVGKLKIEFQNYMSFASVDKFKEKFSSLGELSFPNASRDFIDK